MEFNLEQIALAALGVAIASTETVLNQKADEVADKVIAAVNDSTTQLDDVAAKRLAGLLARIAARIEAGV